MNYSIANGKVTCGFFDVDYVFDSLDAFKKFADGNADRTFFLDGDDGSMTVATEKKKK